MKKEERQKMIDTILRAHFAGFTGKEIKEVSGASSAYISKIISGKGLGTETKRMRDEWIDMNGYSEVVAKTDISLVNKELNWNLVPVSAREKVLAQWQLVLNAWKVPKEMQEGIMGSLKYMLFEGGN